MPDLIATDARVPRYLDYPYSVVGNGRPATTTADDHLRDLILQVLFTSPGERVNLPEFGVGIQRLVFEPSSDAMRASVQFLVSTNLQRWLNDRIDVEQVQVTSEPGLEETVTIEIVYVVKNTRQRQRLQVQA
ncbi:MAG TPA: GPW/gp25 family protein [Gemmataceae bacterium]|nr:GPW/gp25 family protein [Gemmataceae bacterium]